MRQVGLVLVFVLAMGACLPVLARVLRRHPVARRVVGVVLLCACAYGTARFTLLGRRVRGSVAVNLHLLWSYRSSLSSVDGELRVARPWLLVEILLNVLLFVPLGESLPFAAPSVFYRRGFWRGLLLAAAVGCACSLMVELLQWRLRLGFFELDDMLNNTIGCALGYVWYRLVARVVRVATGDDDPSGRRPAGKHFARRYHVSGV